MPVLYGFPQCPASVHAARRRPSTCSSQEAIWFQPAGISWSLAEALEVLEALVAPRDGVVRLAAQLAEHRFMTLVVYFPFRVFHRSSRPRASSAPWV